MMSDKTQGLMLMPLYLPFLLMIDGKKLRIRTIVRTVRNLCDTHHADGMEDAIWDPEHRSTIAWAKHKKRLDKLEKVVKKMRSLSMARGYISSFRALLRWIDLLFTVFVFF